MRTWATPLTIGSFVLMAATGLLLFFEWNTGLTTIAHQWFSWLFLIGVAGHLTINFRPLKNHLKSGWGRASIALFAAILVASLFSWGQVTGPQLERPIMEALVDAPLSVLAELTQRQPESLLRGLEANGISAATDDTVAAVAVKNKVGINRLLGQIFLPERKTAHADVR
ncbi:hypothetical protein CG51_03490 [Haematobacter missouriensis]|uniref:DUF4405 domain-containing protein n=2 Tax=Haematobacter missouriensis TaxID=366616 RepID=A0A212AWS8_9RHOB|nr:hypothetical protein [Haematobacter missouriensis]KFI33948.1 hypothetical protein CG51_03490 [Haematobacter missouriensis]OWJ71281.1 hypothetical protein CDV53_18970 [Haematobacter missouriensis]OWJ85942.1 hypothetical protein CDV52_01900 [Haematobacter missouriensis]